MKSRLLLVFALFALCASGCAFTARSSQTSGGVQADTSSQSPSVSDDGRFVAFATTAANLVSGDTNGWSDVFVKDHATGAVTRVSVASDGTQANGLSYEPVISGDGRWVVFTSLASNLVPTDANPLPDVFLHDRQTGTTTLVSRGEFGIQLTGGGADQPDVSADGGAVVFRWNPSSGVDQVYRYDAGTGAGEAVSVGLGSGGSRLLGPADSRAPSITADGDIVAFQSLSIFGFLVDPSTSSTWSVAVSQFQDGQGLFEDGWAALTFVSGNGSSTRPDIVGTVDAGGGWTGAIAFESLASNLVPSDTNGQKDVFVHHQGSGTSSRSLISLDAAGGPADGPSRVATISEDERWVSFASDATDLVAGDSNGVGDVFVRDRSESATFRTSVAHLGTQASDASRAPELSGDGRHVAFVTDATDIIFGDSNGVADVILRHVVTPTIDGVAPNTLPAGDTTTVVVTGTYLDLGPISFDSDADVTFGPVSATGNPGEFQFKITVPAGAPAAQHDLYVLLEGTGLGSDGGAVGQCLACWSITTGH